MPPAPIFNYPSDDKLNIVFACPMGTSLRRSTPYPGGTCTAAIFRIWESLFPQMVAWLFIRHS
jgi:hypothetical protein